MFIYLKKIIKKILFKFNIIKDTDNISYIISINNESKKLCLLRMLNNFLPPMFINQDIIIVTNNMPAICWYGKRKIKYASSLPEAITIAKGEYLCFLDKYERFSLFGLKHLHNVISKYKSDIYLSNSFTRLLNIRRVKKYNNVNFSDSVLPINLQYGVKVLSRKLIINLRLPKATTFEYILNATDKTKNITFIKYPIIHNNIKYELSRKLDYDNTCIKINKIKERYYFNNKVPFQTIKTVIYIIPRLNKNTVTKSFINEISSLLIKKIRVHIYCLYCNKKYKNILENTGAVIFISHKRNLNDSLGELQNIIIKNRYCIINITNSKFGYKYSIMSASLPFRPVIINRINKLNFNTKNNLIDHQVYFDKIIFCNNKDKILMNGTIIKDKVINEEYDILNLYKKCLKKVGDKLNKLTTIAILSFNRKDAIKKTLDSIYRNTSLPFNIIILDNGSERETKNFLLDYMSKHKNINCIFEKKNIGCPGGRNKLLKIIKSDYIVTLDNDMEVSKLWLNDLILRIEENKKVVGVCAKYILPNKITQFASGTISKDDDGFYLFNANNYGQSYDDLMTLKEVECDWLPGGASLWRGDITDIAEHSKDYINAFEDYDYSIQISKKGYKMVNCPYVMFTHNHLVNMNDIQKEKEKKYIKDRYNKNGLILSLSAFYKRTGLIMRNDMVFNILNISKDTSPIEVCKIVKKAKNNLHIS